MYSEAQNSLWSNELLLALSNDPNLSQGTKSICQKLKYQHNAWQHQLKERGRTIKYPDYDQADIVRLNCTWRANIEKRNTARKNQQDTLHK